MVAGARRVREALAIQNAVAGTCDRLAMASCDLRGQVIGGSRALTDSWSTEEAALRAAPAMPGESRERACDAMWPLF